MLGVESTFGIKHFAERLGRSAFAVYGVDHEGRIADSPKRVAASRNMPRSQPDNLQVLARAGLRLDSWANYKPSGS